jgi:isopentenyl diphosphate isomerase/L-lactate dehydrogenase-like FMN-dependent dehydrogenase
VTGPFDTSQLRTIDEVIARARSVLDPGIRVWAEAGAGQGVTTARNTVALGRLALVPRVMRDVGDLDLATSFAGVPLAFPVMLAPVGALALYDPGDALAAAQVATEAGITAFCGMLATSPWEEVARTAPGRHFFQLYVLGDRGWLSEILARVENSGFAALCVTVDTPVIGRRDRSLETGFTWTVTPEASPNLARHGLDYSHRARFTRSDLEWLVEHSKLPVIVKGVMTPEDASDAVATGVAGVYVSNHGGRVVDHGVSTIEVLAEIVEATSGRVDVAIDSGFARGADVCKALALGAKAVGIGRLQCWGLAAGGAAGLSRVLEILREEIGNTMANLGCRSVSELNPGHVRWSIPASPG